MACHKTSHTLKTIPHRDYKPTLMAGMANDMTHIDKDPTQTLQLQSHGMAWQMTYIPLTTIPLRDYKGSLMA
eukprot:465434-Amorphochlora_amoeboformis.AAC.1